MSPEKHYQRMMQYLTQWVLPTLGPATQQGATLDIPEVTKEMAQYLGLETFSQFYKTAVPNQLEKGIPYTMQPTKSAFGQTSDAFGTTEGNRQAQSSRVQLGQGYGGETGANNA